MLRRRLLIAPAAGLAATWPAWGLQRRSLADPLRVGVDTALMDSGLAHAWQLGFARDTGVALQLVPQPALPLLEALERGELDVALANAPDAEARLEKDGLAHDRHAVALGGFVIVGPMPLAKAGDALGGPALLTDAAAALRRLHDAPPDGPVFLTAGDGSGTHMAEQALWRLAQTAPVAPWYATQKPGGDFIAQVRERRAYALVEHGAWLARGGAPLAIRTAPDARLDEAVHVMRSFRVNHPAGKFFVAWVAGAKGRRVAAAHPGYRAAAPTKV